MRAIAILGLAAAACGGCGAGSGQATLLWSHDPDGYFSDSNFADSEWGRQRIFVHRRGDFGGELTSLDPATGAVRWSRAARWYMHPPGTTSPLWIANRSDRPLNQYVNSWDLETLERIDPVTGKTLAVVALDHPISTVMGDRLFWADGRILAMERGRLSAIDPTTGKTLWRVALADTTYSNFAPVVHDHTVVLQGTTYVAIDARDGRTIFRQVGECCTAKASPDGRHLYLRTAVKRSVELDWGGAVVAERPGDVDAVSDRFVAVQEAARFAVYRHGSRDPVWQAPTDAHRFIGAVTLAGDQLFYFDSTDDTLWRRDLDGGGARPVKQAHQRLVISTDATGMSPAYLGTPPVWDPPVLFLLDWSIEAIRLE